MTNAQTERIILAIESAVAGGSISLFRGKTEIANWGGEGGVSRAEHLLPNIASLLENSGIGRKDLTQLAVSTGPGSYTGIRIGIATALGLKNALKIPCAGIIVTDAMRAAASSGKNTVTAVPMGKNDVCRYPVSGESVVTTYSEFLEFVRSNNEIQMVVEKSLYLRLIESQIAHDSLINAGANLAFYVGLAALKPNSHGNLEPLFVKAQ
jgi:universal bacterial protein YeaZ